MTTNFHCGFRFPHLLAGAALLASLCLQSPADAAEPQQRPNIVFILADDLGYTDLGCTGSGYYETPNIDRLASQGMSLTRYYHCQNCQPTRAALMSGQYGARTGVFTVGSINRFNWQQRSLRPPENVIELPLDRITIAQALQDAGYTTGMFGKWHLGNSEEYHPSNRGFQEAIVSQGAHFNFKTSPQTDSPEGQYLADFLTDRAEEFIRRHKDEPFFLYLPHYAVHAPIQAREDHIKRFQPKPAAGGHKNPVYAAMIASVDDSVGRISKLLDELKLSDNTVLIFSSDNGGVGGYDREGLPNRNITDNAPLRSGKGSLYEGGTRVPFIVRWPGVVEPGSRCDVPATHVDLYPTFLNIANAKAPAGYTLDGENLATLFRDPAANWNRKSIYHHFPGYLGAGTDHWRTLPVGVIIQNEWKLMEFFEDGRLELYNLNEDVGESQNLADQQPERAQRMLAELREWREQIHAPMPTPNTPKASPPENRRQRRQRQQQSQN